MTQRVVPYEAPTGTYVSPSGKTTTGAAAPVPWLNPRDYGAACDARRVYGAAITSGSNVITAPAGVNIGPADIGKPVAIVGAGATLTTFNPMLAQNQFAPLVGFIGAGSAGTTINVVTTSGGSTPANASRTVTASTTTPYVYGTNAPSPTGTLVWGTDDSAAWQAIVNAAGDWVANTGRPITIELPGRSVLTAAVLWTDTAGNPANGVSLVGRGRNSSGFHFIGAQNGTQGAIWFTQSMGSGFTYFIRGCLFSAFEVDGCGVSNTAYAVTNKGFAMSNGHGMRYEDIYVHDFPATGFSLDYQYYSVGFGCEAANNGRGQNGAQPGGAGFGLACGQYALENMEWIGCTARLNGGYGLFYEKDTNTTNSTGAKITGGRFFNNGIHGIGDCGAVGMKTVGAKCFGNLGSGYAVAQPTYNNSIRVLGYNGTVLDCDLHDNGGAGFFYDTSINHAAVAPTYTGLYTVSGCRIYNNVNAGMRFDIGADATAAKFSITDNDIFDNVKVGVWFRYQSGTGLVTDIDILTNRIIHNGTGAAALNDDGIRIDINATGLRIKQNTITGNLGYGLNIGATFAGTITAASILGNDFTGSAANTSGALNIASGVTQSNVVIEGNPGYIVGPTGDLLASGEETIRRDIVTNGAVSMGSSGDLRLNFFTARKTEAITQIVMRTGTTAAGATPTLVRLGIYSEDPATKNLTLVAAIANDTTIFAAASTDYTRTLTSTFNKVAGARYAVAVLVVTAAAMPTMTGPATSTISTHLQNAPRLNGLLAGQTDLPGSITSASIASSTVRQYSELLP